MTNPSLIWCSIHYENIWMMVPGGGHLQTTRKGGYINEHSLIQLIIVPVLYCTVSIGEIIITIQVLKVQGEINLD